MATDRNATTPSRLSIDDWLQAGFATLAETGSEGLKLEKLTGRLGVTKGSFYWHFSDMNSYRNALIEAWGAGLAEDHRRMAAMDTVPRERLTAMMAILISPQHWALELCMREWARSSTAAADAVRASDRRVLKLVRKVFLDAGFDNHLARTRAEWTFAIGIGYLSLAEARPNFASTARLEEFVEFMLRRTAD